MTLWHGHIQCSNIHVLEWPLTKMTSCKGRGCTKKWKPHLQTMIFVCKSGTKRDNYFSFPQEYVFFIHWVSLVKTLGFTEDVLTFCDLTWEVPEVRAHSSFHASNVR